jgi:ribosome biogenesis GTPase A
MSIQWYPGHMAKATRLMKEELKKVDVVIVLGDARAVERSINRDFFEVIKNKRRILVFNKSDLADESVNQMWKSYFSDEKETIFFVDCMNKKGIGELVSHIKNYKQTMRYDRAVHVMIAGIPNVGKSMLINTLAKRNAAQASNRPGVTRANQWIKVGWIFTCWIHRGIAAEIRNEEDGYVFKQPSEV